jgi:recombination protein RecT
MTKENTPVKQDNKIEKQSQFEIVENVLSKVNELAKAGQLRIPKDYSPENALKAAYLILVDQKNKAGLPVLKACTPASISNSLLNMVVEGLNPLKHQCAIYAFGDKLTYIRQYQGDIALAKRANPNIDDVKAFLIYEGGVFVQEFDVEKGRYKLAEYNNPFESIDITKIKGGFGAVYYKDGTVVYDEPMTMPQIRNAWEMGYGKGDTKAHNNFTDQMVKKTIIQRTCKPIIESSSDLYLMPKNDEDTPKTQMDAAQEQAKRLSATKTFDFDDAEEVVDDSPEKPKEKPAPTVKTPDDEPDWVKTGEAPKDLFSGQG